MADRPACVVCKKSFSRTDNLLRHHQQKHTEQNQVRICQMCNYTTSRSDAMARHMKNYHKLTAKRLRLEAPYLDASVKKEKNVESYDVKKKETPTIVKSENTIVELLEHNKWRIQNYAKENNRLQDRYNFAITNPTARKIKALVLQIFQRQKYAFKLNASFGFILENIITGGHEYFYASGNNRLLPKPVTINSLVDIETFMQEFENEDVLEYCKQQRHNTRFVVERITNVLFYVNKLKPFPIGCEVELPTYIRRRTSIVGLTKNNRMQPYGDNFCLFRCLAYHMDEGNFEELTLRLVEGYCRKRGIDHTKYKGTSFKEIQDIEDYFELNIEVYSLEQERNDYTEVTRTIATKKLWSRMKYEDTVNVNLYQRHFSYIKSLKIYTQFWSCKKCRKAFDRLYNCSVHERHCLNKTKFIYPGGGYGNRKSIFDELEESGCQTKTEDTFYPYRIAFDFESLSVEIHTARDPDAKLQYLKQLIPASVSVCSNVPGYMEPNCFISQGDPMELMGEMYTYISEISRTSYGLMSEKHSETTSFLQTKLEELEMMKEELRELRSEREEETDFLDEIIELEEKIYRYTNFKHLARNFDRWLRQIPLLGFNSGKFDINLIRRYLFPYLLTQGVDIDYIIKKGNDYLCITTGDVIFLDIKNFIAPGTSYEKWLKSSGVNMTKGFWPYDWWSSLRQLDEPQLVGKEAFWSNLKQKGISDEDYSYLQNVWREQGFQTMRDLLVWYNNLDTLPFIEAAQKLHDNWRELGIDAFKSGNLSLPGLALSLQMRRVEPHTILPRFREETHNLLRSNIVGGLSIVTHRYHEAGVTNLPNGSKVTRIYSHDCNSLYLWALGENMGTGLYVHWRQNSDMGTDSLPWKRSSDRDLRMKWNDIKQSNDQLMFRKLSGYPGLQEQIEWLEYMSHKQDISIEHKLNGREKVVRVSQAIHYPVDGFHRDSNTVYQFHGCLWHGHGCQLDTEKNPGLRDARRNETLKVTAKLRDLGYAVIEKWECSWLNDMKQDPTIQAFLEETIRVKTKTSHLYAREIIQKVKTDEFFGLVECDIEVPWWDERIINRFDEFPPLYKNTDISVDQIGNFMRTFATERGLMTKPRRCLVNSFWAKKILLTTPLLKWYLQQGLEITRIYQAIEMKARNCFSDLRTEIANHRREGDLNPDYKPQGENWKLVGNSCYGKSVTNKTRHKDTTVQLDENVGKYINDRKFSKMEEVGDIAYEICSDKAKITEDLPIVIGFFVYNSSKLRMLQFVYDFLKKYLRPGSFQIICSDTDSIVAAYEDTDLDNLVRNELRAEYAEVGKPNFLVLDQHGEREPGLFKVEAEGKGAIALCSKTYFLWDDDTSKLSTKGLSKTTNSFRKQDFFDVLQTRVAGSGINRGLRQVKDKVYEYKQEKAGLTYLYYKREVLDDGITTKALDV